MTKPNYITEHHDAVGVFRFNWESGILRVMGDINSSHPVILKLRDTGWLPKKVRAIYFVGDPIQLLVGVGLVIYLSTRPPKPTQPTRSFKDIVNRKKSVTPPSNRNRSSETPE